MLKAYISWKYEYLGYLERGRFRPPYVKPPMSTLGVRGKRHIFAWLICSIFAAFIHFRPIHLSVHKCLSERFNKKFLNLFQVISVSSSRYSMIKRCLKHQRRILCTFCIVLNENRAFYSAYLCLWFKEELNFCQNDNGAMCRLQKVDRTETAACVNGIYFSACNTELVFSFTTASVPTEDEF